MNTEELESQQLKRRFKLTVFITGVVILFALLYRTCNGSVQLAEKETLNNALSDSLKVWKDKEGNYKAKITSLETSKTETFTKWKSSDAEVIKLQALVTKYKKELSKKGSATIITTDADIAIKEPTEVIQDTSKPCDPVYKTQFEIYGTGKHEKTKWVWGESIASKDSTVIGLRFHEEIDVVIGEEKTGFLGLGKPKPFAEVTLHNPFNKVTKLKNYNVTPPPAKKFGIGPVIAYGIDSEFSPQFFAGIGVSWNWIRL